MSRGERNHVKLYVVQVKFWSTVEYQQGPFKSECQ